MSRPLSQVLIRFLPAHSGGITGDDRCVMAPPRAGSTPTLRRALLRYSRPSAGSACAGEACVGDVTAGWRCVVWAVSAVVLQQFAAVHFKPLDAASQGCCGYYPTLVQVGCFERLFMNDLLIVCCCCCVPGPYNCMDNCTQLQVCHMEGLCATQAVSKRF